MDINNIGTNMIKLNKEAIKNAMESGTKNKTMQGENFRLGEGVLECDNFYIVLDSISVVEIKKTGDIPIFMAVVGIILGAFCLLIPWDIMKYAGCFLILMSIVNMLLTMQRNKTKLHTLKIGINSGKEFTFQNPDIEFLREVMAAIKECINGKKETYFINMEDNRITQNFENVKGNFVTGSNIGAGATFMNATDQAQQSGNKVENHVNENHAGILNDAEWEQLQNFFEARKKEYPLTDENYSSCENLENCAKEKNAEKMKEYIQMIGGAAFKALITAGVSETLKQLIFPLITRILKA